MLIAPPRLTNESDMGVTNESSARGVIDASSSTRAIGDATTVVEVKARTTIARSALKLAIFDYVFGVNVVENVLSPWKTRV